MDDASTSKMEQCLLLAKGLRGFALAELIHKATAETGIFTFGELLALQEVQTLAANHQYAPAVSLLRLFAHGTWTDYARAQPGQFPLLNPQQERKLRALSVASLAAARRTLPYDDLLHSLDLSSVRELEDLLISDCIYGGIIKGRLDQRKRCLLVQDALGRDIAPERVAEVADAFEAWLQHAQDVLKGMDGQGSWVAAAADEAGRRRLAKESELAAEKKAMMAGFDAGGLADAMEAVMEADVAPPPLEGFAEGEVRSGASQRVSKRSRNQIV